MALGFVRVIHYAYAAPVIATTTIAATSTVQELIVSDAAKYDVPSEEISTVLDCESTMGKYVEGDIGSSTATTSWGIAQINLPNHPDITKAQALNDAFAIDFLAKSIAAGRGYWWTCYREHYHGDNLTIASSK
jgi:hypothetical protein